MDWEKVKKIFIYLLIVLNIGLFGANYITNGKYVLTNSEEAAIYDVLDKNGIGLYTELIKKTPPMSELGISVSALRVEDFRQIFFEGEEVKTTLDFNRTILASNTKSLIVEDNSITYLNPEGTGAIEGFNRDAALKTAEEFLELLNVDNKSNLRLESAVFENDAYVFEYIERFKGYKIFSNIKRITVSENGVTMATASYYTAQDLVGERREIYSCDEVLLTFISAVRKENRAESVYIEKIELGYDFQNSTDVADGSRLRLVPCYRIFVSGSAQAYTINAYTNEIKGNREA